MYPTRSSLRHRLGHTLLGAMIIGGGLAAAGSPSPAGAANPQDLVVTTVIDGTPGSLREAVQAANGDVADDEIVLGEGTYLLDLQGINENLSATGDLDITQPLTIRGAGAGQTIIDASALNDRAMHVHGDGRLTLIGVTVRGGSTVEYGGGIRTGNAQRLTVTDSIFRGNRAVQGGGAIAAFGPINISGSTFRENEATDNSAFGAALYFEIPGNGEFGSIESSSFVDNTSAYVGGAIAGNGMALQIINSTISGNHAAQGSALFNRGGVVATRIWRLDHSTVANNTSAVPTGALYAFDNGVFTLADSIVVDNEGGNCNTAANAQGVNLVADFTCGLGVNYILPPGGYDGVGLLTINTPTPVHVLAADSPAVNATTCDAGDVDQRDVPRPTAAGLCDIGAYERRIIAVDDPGLVVGGGINRLKVLSNDVGYDRPLIGPALAGGSLTVVTPPAHGGTFIENESIGYQPELGYDGPDSFVYEVCLGGECSTATVTLDVQGIEASQFEPLSPQRILDTRATGSKPAAGSTTTLEVLGAGGIPIDGVSAVVLNVTATEAEGGGYVTVYPSGQPQPTVSSVNVEFAGQSIPNLVTVPVGTNGSIELFTYNGTHLIADVAGYYRPSTDRKSGRFQPVVPARLLDTRTDNSGLPANGTRDLTVTGVGGVPTDASAVVLNVTATRSLGAGYVTVWPTGIDRPVVSNVNMSRTDQTIPNLVIVPVGAGGRVSLYSDRGTDLVVDVTGWFTGANAPADVAGLFMPTAPKRILDTRPDQKLAPNETRTLQALEAALWASAVVLNVTATQATDGGYITVWPGDAQQPLASNVNVERADQTIPNAVIVGVDQISEHNEVDIYSLSGTHLVVDIFGYYLPAIAPL